MTIALRAPVDWKAPQNAGRLCVEDVKSGDLQAFRLPGESSCDLRKTTLRRLTGFAFMAAPQATTSG
jgi:hypothetical protein